MKTTSRTISLTLATVVCLLLTQTAHCFYNPQTGRWLSRGPIDEGGGRGLPEIVDAP